MFVVACCAAVCLGTAWCCQYQLSLTDGLNNIASVWGGLATAIGAAEKVFQWIDRVPMIAEGGELSPPSCTGLLEFRNVVFKYPTRPDTVVLGGVSFTVRPGTA